MTAHRPAADSEGVRAISEKVADVFQAPVPAGSPHSRTVEGGTVPYFAFGRTDAGRRLTVVFTLGGLLLRVISARPMSRRERRHMTKRAARKTVPAFATEGAEREFWEAHDASPFIDWDQARVAVFPNLKPSTETISLRLPAALLSELKALASKQDVP
jgi:uncharacterized DUF497 family protein